jgi:hypothetical protein
MSQILTTILRDGKENRRAPSARTGLTLDREIEKRNL